MSKPASSVTNTSNNTEYHEDVQKKILDQEIIIAELNLLLKKCKENEVRLQSKIEEQERQLKQSSLLSRNEVLRLSDWAYTIDQNPLRHALKKYARATAKKIYRALPLNIETKENLKRKVRSALKRKRINTVVNEALQQPITNKPSNSLKMIGDKEFKPKRDIFIFSVIDWDFRIQRPQHLARGFAKKGDRVFFFSNHFVDSCEPGFEIEKIDPSLELYQVKLHVSGAPAIYFSPPTSYALKMLKEGMAKVITEFGAVSSISLMQHAYWFPLVAKLPNTIRVYDCMDHHEGFGNVPEELISIEKEMLKESDMVIVTSSWLENFAREYNSNVTIIRNAVDFEHFNTPPLNRYSDERGRKIIGYYGAIAEWFDIDLIRKVAIDNSDSLVLLVGNDTIDAKKKLADLPNIVMTGEVSYIEIPFYLDAFDVALLPFKVTPLTLATNPVKVYEYLAAGKSTVCVDLPEMSQFGDVITTAKNHIDFSNNVKKLLNVAPTNTEISTRKNFASHQTWGHRIEEFTEGLRKVSLPKISIIVLTYNNLDLTKNCLDSILRLTDYHNIELIIVDNASTDETPEYLTQFSHEYPDTKVILNAENVGFAAGNNIGLKAATGDYLVLLNNDTIVTPGWALTLLRHLQNDTSIGIIGPVTNNIGNEAKIDISYESTKEMLPLAQFYTTAHMGESISLNTVAFFCVMFSKEVYAAIGGLDQNFGRGFFEDDDYCRRVEQLGLRVACADDVFIHHHLSASFNKLKNHEKQTLFDTNKAYYESKWGPWTPHSYRK